MYHEKHPVLFFTTVYCVSIDTRKMVKKNNETNSKVKRTLWEQRNLFCARIKIIWDGKFVDPLIHYLPSVIAPWFLVLN